MPDGKHAAMSAEDMVALLSRSQIASVAVVLGRLSSLWAMGGSGKLHSSFVGEDSSIILG